MNQKQLRVLESLFEDPVRANIAWRDVESLLVALGAEVTQGSGSRVRVMLNGVRAVFHEPHPGKEISKAAVRSVREFLTQTGNSP
jgi:hypothetical protein